MNMTRLAVLSDVHGNLPALEAVLADIELQGMPDVTWVLGDLAAFCPWPSETLARLRAIPNVAFLQGNTDRYLVTGQRPVFPIRSSRDWANAPGQLAERDANFRWTVERLSYADYEFLRDLPLRLETSIPGYGRILAVHASPTDDETVLLPDTPDEDVRPHLSGLDARLLLYGHVHRPVDRFVDTVRIVNDGSVGLPLDGDHRPAYGLLDFEDSRCAVTIRRVAYDREAVIAELERVEHPAQEWVGRILRAARV
ncbi:MAG: metallophosphoesterase family protein [Chloroflexota bacterium]|nr:metallophosphoesterase family protein [Chloroflexota bacterium]